MMGIVQSWVRRLSALLDKSAWLLMLPAILGLLWADVAAAQTLVQWSLFGLVLAGASVIISRIVFPHLDLSRFLDRAAGDGKAPGDLAAAIVAASVILFVGLLMLALVLWAKPL